ncbi:MAG: hypothetical protein GF307_10310 [candidate division Zixibacteria bacterium]|nr:hypothetical protein [candidate division Zixibacteria bacterium]
MEKKKTTKKKTTRKTAKKKTASQPKLSKSMDTALDGLKVAIQTEIDGYNFYTLAAGRTKSDKGKKMFQFLADEEVKHKKYLEAKYRDILETGKIGELPQPTKVPKTYKTKSPIFTAEFSKRAKLPAFEMTALSIGILLEERAIQFFKDQAKKIHDTKAKKVFNSLADWEGEHLELLMHHHKMLTREYWEEARFEPLY